MKTEKEIRAKLEKAEEKCKIAVDPGIFLVECVRIALLEWVLGD
jgi:hypothetical protein